MPIVPTALSLSLIAPQITLSDLRIAPSKLVDNFLE